MMRRLSLVFCFLCFVSLTPLAFPQQPVQALGSGVQNTSDAAWTSATGSNTAVSIISNTATYNTVMVTLVQGTTITGGVVTFEQSIDNSTWTTVQGVTLGATTIMGPTYTLVASTNVSFLFPVNAPYFRVRLSTVITGTGTVTIQHASQTLPAVGLLAGTETLAAGTNVIGHVIADTGSTTAVTQATGTNLHAVLDTTSTTAVTQATGTNLHVVVDTAPTTAVSESGTWNVGVNNWGGTALGTPTNFGTTPGAVIAGSVNSSLFIGTTIVSSSNPFPISATGAANTKTNEIFANISDHTNSLTAALSALGTAPTGTEVMAVNAVQLPSTAAGVALSSAGKATVTSSVNVKASAGNVYGLSIVNGAGAGCWLELINSASAGTLGTAVIFNIALPTSGTLTIPPGTLALGNFSSGIAVGAASAIGGSSACGTAVTGVTVFYQ
jgi:hypothetical protein